MLIKKPLNHRITQALYAGASAESIEQLSKRYSFKIYCPEEEYITAIKNYPYDFHNVLFQPSFNGWHLEVKNLLQPCFYKLVKTEPIEFYENSVFSLTFRNTDGVSTWIILQYFYAKRKPT